MKTIVRSFVLLLALLVSVPVSNANAEEMTAKQRFDQAAAAYAAGRYSEAAQLFMRAYERDRHPEILYNAARSYDKAGDLPNALTSYRRFLLAAPTSKSRPEVTKRIDELEAKQEQQLAQQREASKPSKPIKSDADVKDAALQVVTVASTPSGATVLLDGRTVGKTPWSGEIAPGEHVIVLRRAGHPNTTRHFVLTAQRRLDLRVMLAEPTVKPASMLVDSEGERGREPSTTRYAEPFRDSAETEPRVRPLTWVAFGVGAAALGGALGFELARQSAEDDAKQARTQVEYREHYDTMEQRQTTSRILAGVGAAAIVTGGVLFAIDLNRDRKRGVAVGVGCQLSVCSVAARGRLP